MDSEALRSSAEHTSLTLILHAFTQDPESMKFVSAAVSIAKPSSFVLCPSLPTAALSFEDPTRLALGLVERIDDEMTFRRERALPEFSEITLVGHSLGALLARKVYVIASGETTDAPFEFNDTGTLVLAKPWARLITRIILLAGMNRGWSVTSHLNPIRATFLAVASAFGTLVLSLSGKRLLGLQTRRGAPFLTDLRLQWIALQRRATREGFSLAITIQLLGTIDDVVSPDDNIDLASGREFFYLDVPHSGHRTVIDMDNTHDGKERRSVFNFALIADELALRQKSYVPADAGLPRPDPTVTDVVFVIHGIRDAGYWTRKIARKIQELGNVPPRMYASETSTYGYFAMLPFLLPFRRHKKVEWLMDQFVEARSLYQHARFAFVGHSNGTYLLGYALKHYRACTFEHVVFAGSVLRRSYDWKPHLGNGQVKAILNYVATSDWVVAWFPGALEKLGVQDMGSAGHNGFTLYGQQPNLYERRYIPGSHGAALKEENWEDIASFIVNGLPSPFPSLPLAGRRNFLVVGVGWVAPVVWILIIMAIGLGARAILIAHVREWQKTLELVIFAWLIFKVLTKV